MAKAPEPSGGDQHKGAKETNSIAVEADLLRHECELVRTAYAILLRRRRRYDQFKADMFGEPAWDMLLEVYVREISGSSSTDEQLQLASATAASTAGRWLQYLETEGLVARRDRPFNGRTEFVELTDLGRKAMDEYLGSILDLAPAAGEPSLKLLGKSAKAARDHH